MPGKTIPPKLINQIDAKTGQDVLTGTTDVDSFNFKFTDNKNSKDDTLDTGDAIKGYQHGEDIKIDGILLNSGDVTLVESKTKQEVTLQIDTNGDGKADVDLVLKNYIGYELDVVSSKKDGTTTISVSDDPMELDSREHILLSAPDEKETEDSFIFHKTSEIDRSVDEEFIVTQDMVSSDLILADPQPILKSEMPDMMVDTNIPLVLEDYFDMG